MEFEALIITPKLEDVLLRSSFHETINGTLCLTGHHLIVQSSKENFQEFWLLHQAIDFLERLQHSTDNGGTLIIKCKDFRIFYLEVNCSEKLLDVYISIGRLANLNDTKLLYPFFYRPMYNILEDGYALFKPENEFTKLVATDEWRVSLVNKNYIICNTYSTTLIVPKDINDEHIIESANFRQGGRFPMLSYRHRNSTVLLRSSQPMLNNCSRRCRADEKILNAVLGPLQKGYIIDTRSSSYINTCKGKGGGTEPEGYYTRWKKVFKPLDKISKCDGSLLDNLSKLIDGQEEIVMEMMRLDSSEKKQKGTRKKYLSELVTDVSLDLACSDVHCSPEKWLSKLETCNWLTQIQNCINASCLIAQCMDKDGASVLVHGSQGFDTTLILASLTQIILNPDCRTVRGLQALIDREWLQAGHPFQKRNSKSCYSNLRSKDQQPTFLLFLDCVHQLYYQFPCSFEFKMDMLISIFEHSYFSQFGTFLGNCESERNNIEVFRKTISLWSYLNRPDILISLLNPMYKPNRFPIWPSVAPVSLRLWNELYSRYTVVQISSKKAVIKMQKLMQTGRELRNQATKMRKRLSDLLNLLDNMKPNI